MLPAILAIAMTMPSQERVLPETPDARAKRMKWFKEARFGLFIHWGVYAVPAGRYGNRTNHAEWIMETGKVPLNEYEQWRDQFNPTKFNASEWASLAKEMGVKYVTITTKHHDGFALFDSKHSDWDIMSTPFKRDIMKELSDAVRKEGLVQCWYHSIMDWHHPDYEPHRAWSTKQPADANMDRYVKYLHNQVTELLTNYGPIGVMWFDGEWERTWSHARGVPLYNLCRTLQPNVIVNNRVDVGRGGMAGMSDKGYAGDYGTPEQEVPATGLPGVDWESCITMNRNWGYNEADLNYKSTAELIQLLVDVVSKGGNLLLNIGPKADGTIPPMSVERMKGIGKWMKVNGEAIYGTEASPFKSVPWGRVTQKPTRGGTELYLHVFEWPSSGTITVSGLGNDVASARVLGFSNKVNVSRRSGDLVLDAGKIESDGTPVVIRLTVKGEPIVYEAPQITSDATIFVKDATITVSAGSKGLMTRYTTDGSDPTDRSAIYRAPIVVTGAKVTVKAVNFHNEKAVSGVTSYELTRVVPLAPAEKSSLRPGVSLEIFAGEFDDTAEMLKAQPGQPKMLTSFDLGELATKENIGARYRGVLKVPQDEVYTFDLTSDDGSKLLIDGKVVVDNDGLHSPTSKKGQIALARGMHVIEVLWFNRTGGATLDLMWNVAGQKATKVTAEDLWHGE